MSEQNILATIDGVNITDADLDAYIANLPKEQQAYAEKKPIPLSCRTSLRDCSSTLPVQQAKTNTFAMTAPTDLCSTRSLRQ